MECPLAALHTPGLAGTCAEAAASSQRHCIPFAHPQHSSTPLPTRPRTRAQPAMGVRQEPSSADRNARSHTTARRVSSWFRAARAAAAGQVNEGSRGGEA